METAANILLVDDDSDIRYFVGKMLRSRGYVVSCATDYNTTLALLSKQTFDLVLLDITLPDRSGLDVLEFITRNGLQCTVIMLTGTAGLDLAIRSVSLGAKDYITKPCSPNYLLRSIEDALSVQHP